MCVTRVTSGVLIAMEKFTFKACTHNVTVPVSIKSLPKFITVLTMAGRMGVQPILPVRVPVIIDTMINFDGGRHGDVMCKQSFRKS